ncbi:MAG: protein-glutamate O-methyltransferase CheR [Deltaproteobacteria bacterium]|nr:protein-glutamate O-methyltransferase CheR [Deltaproteobacteria bacterium]
MNHDRPARKLSDKDFLRVSRFIHQQYGIHLPPAKKTLLEGRLRKRMKQCAIDSFRGYCDYLFTDQGMKEESIYMVDAVTTNKTDFFREPYHFEFLTLRALPELIEKRDSLFRKKIQVWSAACSTGEEPYSLAMVLSEFSLNCPGFDYSILATDISTKVLDIAETAIYNEEKIRPVPHALRKKYLLKSKDPRKKIVRITPELRDQVAFRRFNLMDGPFPIDEPLDIIFCRNVMIYFDGETQERLVRQFHECLSPGGYLFMGHAESINNMNVPLRYVAPTIYQKEMQP